MRIYLAGPINATTDNEAKDWRNLVKASVSGVSFCDPMDRDYRGRELEPGIAKEIVEGDKADIDACDTVLVYYERPSVGTSMEVLYAWERGKYIIVVDQSGKPVSPWLLYHSSARAESLSAAVAFLRSMAAEIYAER